MNRHTTQAGVTLVELMIAMTIGLFIIAGIGQIFLSTRASYNVQERMSHLQENGRFGLVFLQRSLRMAGFPKSDALNPVTDDPSNAACPMTTPAAACTGSSAGTCEGAGTASDQIAVCYQGTTDCLGQTIAGTIVVDTFFINVDPSTGVSRLMCRGNGNAQAQPLVDGIESMQIQYGEDTDADGYANRYVTAAGVSNWRSVLAVRVALLASSKSNDAAASAVAGTVMGDTAADAQSYTLLDQVLDAGTLSTGVRGRVFSTTIEMRNRSP